MFLALKTLLQLQKMLELLTKVLQKQLSQQ